MLKYGFPLLFGDPFPGLLFRWAATTLVALDEVSFAVDLTAPSLVAPGQDENKEKTPPEDFQVLAVWVLHNSPSFWNSRPQVELSFLVEKQDIE